MQLGPYKCSCEEDKHEDVSQAHQFLHEVTEQFVRQGDMVMKDNENWKRVRTHWMLRVMPACYRGSLVELRRHCSLPSLQQLAAANLPRLVWRDHVTDNLEMAQLESARRRPDLFEVVWEQDIRFLFRIRK